MSQQEEVSHDEVASIIRTELQSSGVSIHSIPSERPFNPEKRRQIEKNSKRYFVVRGIAKFSCTKCRRWWPSAQAWCFIDLKEQEICYTYYQKCKRCYSKAKPKFAEKAVKGMSKYAVKKFLYRTGQKEKPERRKEQTKQTKKPHLSNRCQRCKEKKRRCC